MTLHKRHWIITFFGIGMTLIITGLLPLFLPVSPVIAQEPPPPHDGLYNLTATAITPTGDNSYCAVCHNQPSRTVNLADGFILNLFVPPSAIGNSVHGTSNADDTLGCVDCHGADAFPHDNPPDNRRDYTITANQTCVGCHNEQATDLQSGLHEQAILAGNVNAAVCTDCHGAHDVQTVAREPQLVAGVCGDCHTTTYSEWRTSPHIEVGVLGCATCHSPHAQTIRIDTADTNDLCMNCHKTMPDIWSHTQHIATESNTESDEVGCIDCHMHTSDTPTTQFISDAPTGHSMSIATVACTSCHEGLTQQISTDTTPPTLPHSDILATPADESAPPSDMVTLLQGLILGLGFGITGAVVFITRGNKHAHQGENHHE